ncbi:hypothetical protein H5123_10585 [Shewanella sp. SR43-4]|uniref:hypothetical protein n=1 Tax=unclassified Shewanella TaxID=196818 RepID=UPI0015FDE968|nr:hypothetical protein [Shewanella sp. SR43-4]MBB1318082.1 hypothetical protein [Shewanella sp. SR43-4]
MLYALKVIDDHPCFKMQDLLNNFFYYYVFDIAFNNDIFPNNFSTKYINGNGKYFKQSLENTRLDLPVLKSKKRQLYSQFINNNSIEALCLEKTFIPEDNMSWSKGQGKRLNDFMLNCYETKLDLSPFRRPGCKEDPTHRFYADFIDINGSVCPFCGLNSYKNKFGSRREDLDHYLFKGRYPLAAVNMWNLIPTCSECNQVYKRTLDILYDGIIRKEAFYPYGKVGGISLKISLNIASDNKKPNSWQVIIKPRFLEDKEKVDNWIRVYGITKRYMNALAQDHDNWIQIALTERKTKFNSILCFRKFMLSRARNERKYYINKLAPTSFLKQSFFVFVARSADDVFIKKYMIPFNAGL